MYETILKLFRNGGPLMLPIVACSLAAIYIIVERFLFLHRAKINVPEWLHGLKNVLKRNSVVEAITTCDETPGPVAQVVRAAILHCDRDEAKLRHAIEEASLNEIPVLEKNLRGLANIAQVAMLFGLLGTVLGIIGVFEQIERGGSFVSTSDLAKNTWQALLTTAAGLTVAIPAYASYHFLAGRVQDLLHDIERASSEIIFFLSVNKIQIDPRIFEHASGQNLDKDDPDAAADKT